MGRYSSDTDEDKRKRSKKKKRRSRSRSVDSDRISYSKHKKSKKSRSRHYSRSRSRTPTRPSRRRSRSYDKYRSSRRSSSYEAKRYSRSRSKSYDRSRRRRSYSRSRSRSRSPTKQNIKQERDPCASIDGFNEMTEAEKTKVRMQMALKAAAEADTKLKQMDQGVALSGTSMEEQLERQKCIDEIQDTGFVQHSFKSSRSDTKTDSTANTSVSHDGAIFGRMTTGDVKINKSDQALKAKTESIAHPNLHISTEVKMERWRHKLVKLWEENIGLH